MTTVTTNYTVVGNPTISSDYVLTGTDANNYLNFNNYGILDVSKAIDIIFKFRASSLDEYYGILTIGDISVYGEYISIYYSYGRIYCRFGNVSLSIMNSSLITQDMYYKVSYIPSEAYAYIYYSEDGESWTLGQQRPISTPPSITVANNLIGVYSSEYLIENMSFFDLKEFEIISDGNTWFKAVQKQYDPVVEATDVFSSNKTFRSKKQITSINCNNVQFVNDDMSFAFTNCTNLVSISNINQNTTNMAYAFAGCNTSLYDTGFPQIPNSVNDITGLFAYHTDWTDIPVQAFVNAWSKVPAHLQTNVAGFLDGCTNLSNVPSNTLPNFMTNISYAFRNCKAMTDMPIITENIVDMSEAFYGCSNLVNANYEIPNSVVNMHLAFSNCQNLASAPDTTNATNLMDMSYAYNWCFGITNSKPLPNNVQNIVGLFNSCSNLTTGPNIPYGIQDITRLFSGCSNLVNVPEIPNSVTNMYLTFASCGKLTSAPVIPNSVVNLANTFGSCRNLTEIPALPNSVVDMSGTFQYCYNLVNAPVIPNSVIDMSGTFQSCYNLVNAPVIPNSVTKMYLTFGSCGNLTNFPVIPNSAVNLSYTFSTCDKLFNAPVIPNSVVDMSGTFQSCYNLVNAPVIPNSVINMYSTFIDCQNLVNAPVIPNSVINLSSTFSSCRNLVNAPVIPNSVTDMSATFQYCSNLVNAPVIPNSVNVLTSTFTYCYNLVNPPVIPNTISSMSLTFYYCRNLAYAPDIPNSVVSMDRTFYSCSNLKGSFNIYSTEIINMNQFATTNVGVIAYIPFKYANGEFTKTYNSAISAGYIANDAYLNVMLRDINGTYPEPVVREVDLSNYTYTTYDKFGEIYGEVSSYTGSSSTVIIPDNFIG